MDYCRGGVCGGCGSSWTSTIWKKDYENGYIGAFLGDGLRLPCCCKSRRNFAGGCRAFSVHTRLTQAWAFKHDSARRGLNIHADAAAVNVNFWITPDEANLDPASGGWWCGTKEAPRDWDFKTYNSDARGRIYEWLEGAGGREITIPCAPTGRVVQLRFVSRNRRHCLQGGFTNRRINVTLLYGHRHRPEQLLKILRADRAAEQVPCTSSPFFP